MYSRERRVRESIFAAMALIFFLYTCRAYNESKGQTMATATAEKALDVTSIEDAKAKVSDIVVTGNGDTFQLLCKASSKSQGWMKSAKAMEIPGVGCVVQVTTQNGDNVAEAVAFVPGAEIVPDVNGGRKLQKAGLITEMTPETGAQFAASAYRAYAASVGNKNFRGEPMPAFDDLPEATRTAWQAVIRQATANCIEGRIVSEIEPMWNGWTPTQ